MVARQVFKITITNINPRPRLRRLPHNPGIDLIDLHKSLGGRGKQAQPLFSERRHNCAGSQQGGGGL